jgi:hypothetical protein
LSFGFFSSSIVLFLISQSVQRAQIFFSVLIKPVAAPGPQLRFAHQASLHRIHVHIVQFFGALFAAQYVEIVEAALRKTARRRTGAPESELMRGGSSANSAAQAAGDALLEYLHHEGGIAFPGLADQNVDVLGHHDVADDRELIAVPHFVEDDKENVAGVRASKKPKSALTTEGNEVEVPEAVAAFEVFGHVETKTKTKTKTEIKSKANSET